MNEVKLLKVFDQLALSVRITDLVVNLPITFERRYDFSKMVILDENRTSKNI